jgi:hypothetical protein
MDEVVEIYNKAKVKALAMQFFSVKPSQISNGNMFSLMCEMRHVVILRSKKNSVKIKTNSFCFLSQFSSLSSRQKLELELSPVSNPNYSVRQGYKRRCQSETLCNNNNKSFLV